MSQASSSLRAASDEATSAALDAGGDAMLGLAALGKVAVALALIIALILLASYLLKRVGPGRQLAGQRLRVVGGTAVGNRERVVIVEVDATWLVLGVGGGQVTKLHELPAPDPAPAADDGEADSFATRFARALKHNTGARLGRQDASGRGGS